MANLPWSYIVIYPTYKNVNNIYLLLLKWYWRNNCVQLRRYFFSSKNVLFFKFPVLLVDSTEPILPNSQSFCSFFVLWHNVSVGSFLWSYVYFTLNDFFKLCWLKTQKYQIYIVILLIKVDSLCWFSNFVFESSEIPDNIVYFSKL